MSPTPSTPSKRTFGWLAPEHIGRPRHLGTRIGPASPLPTSVDLRSGMPEVYDQLGLGSCVAQALAAGVEYLQRRLEILDRIERPSRLALYFDARAAIGSTALDSGAIIADGIDALRREGWAPEELWPYEPAVFDCTPPAVVLVAGRSRRLVSAEPLAHDLDTLRWELASGNPVAAGIRVYDAFDRVGDDGMIPEPGGGYRGGHAVLLCGYDDARGCFLLRNSWGSEWGAEGYGWIPYSYVLDASECGELHSLRAVRVLREGRPG